MECDLPDAKLASDELIKRGSIDLNKGSNGFIDKVNAEKLVYSNYYT